MLSSTNHTFPSGPATIAFARWCAPMPVPYSVTTPARDRQDEVIAVAKIAAGRM